MAVARSGSLFKGIAIFAAGATFGILAAYQVVPANKAATVAIGPGAATTGSATTGGSTTGTGTTGTSTGTGSTSGSPTTSTTGNPEGFQCARGRNGGATDKHGVTGTQINLATTVVRSGFGAAFLGEVQFAMDAVKNKINRAGGICGRLLNIRYVDDGWNKADGERNIRSFIQQGYFAIPVGPSSEGLNSAITTGTIREAGIPVVGTDGMVISQYTDPWVWPVAVSTASSAKIMAIEAKALGAKSYSIIFDRDYKFGSEAAEAFNAEVTRLTGKPVQGYNKDHTCSQSFCGIIANQTSYGGEVGRFQPGDVVVMFLEPKTALTWMATTGAPTPKDVKIGVWGAQPLFTREFEVRCQSACDQMWVWSGFKPYVEQYKLDAAVKTYVSDLGETKPDADPYNAFSEGGYVGMQLLVAALQKVGPNLTRGALQQALNAMDFNSPLTMQPVLHWRAGDHFSNATMQAFAIQYKGSAAGWRTEATVSDPDPKQTARDAS